jgi:peptidoglycan/xylan/chitin deacetylase (PgdA/CDA1 family)
VLKRAAELLLAHGGAATLAARRRRGSTLILAYHNVVPDDAPPVGDRSLHLPLARFRSQLDRLQETHDVVALASVRNSPSESGKPRACITFDDAYRGAITLALPELARRGLPATVFVAPGLLGNSGCWWDLLADARGSGLRSSVRDHVLGSLRGDGATAIAWARSQGMPLSDLPVHAAIAGVTLGAHTWSHCNLANVDEATCDMELTKPLAWLRARFARVVPWIAYPYGLSAPATADAARRAGYHGALRIDGGWYGSTIADAYALPRLNVAAGLSRDGFILRTSGLLTS